MNLRALAVAGALSCAGIAAASVVHAQATQAADSLARAYREIRAAEVAEDAPALERLAREAASEATRERIDLARAAIDTRKSARTASALRAAEDAIDARRSALAAKLSAQDAAAARELELECAEDLLLRSLAADASDAMIAVGMPTASECESARALLARIDAHLASPGLAAAWATDAPLATDLVAFRANFLSGLAARSRADLDASSGRDATAALATARERLERAARSELRAPAEIAAILALARARSGGDASVRAALLSDAAKSQDPVRALVARIEAWRDHASAPFPAAADGLQALAIAAECRQRLARGERSEAVAAAFDRAFRSAIGTGDAARSAQRLAGALAPRLVRGLHTEDDAQLHAAAAAARAAARTLPAMLAISDATRASMRSQLDALVADAGDPAIAPWLAVPLARELQSARRELDASRVLLAFARAAPSAEGAREALDIALEFARAEAERTASGEVALADALDAAVATYPNDPLHANWCLARVDLALFPRWSLANADRAAQLLLSVPTDAALRPMRDLRRAEIDGLRAGTTVADALDAARKAELVGAGLAAGDHETAARAETLRSQMLLIAGRPAESLGCAELALRERGITAATARRAAGAWLAAALARDNAIDAPHELAGFAARQPEIAESITPAITRLASGTEDAWLRGDRAEARRLAAERLLPLTKTLAEVPATVATARASALAELAAGNAAAALDSAERSVKRWPSDRALLWLRAESCRAQIAADPAMRARAFACFRELSPLAAKSRDEFWWRAQLAQLELLADDPEQRDSVLARVNRLAALDATLGSPTLARRFEALRARCAKSPNGGQR